MGPSRVGGMTHSSSSSGIFFQGDGQSQVAGTSHLSSFGNSSNSIPGNIRSNMVPVSGDVSNTVLNSVASSGPSVGASSLVTDANSGLSGGPRLQRSASINNESYMRLPASPMSFSSNNISISGSSVIDGPSGMPQSSNHDPNSHQVQQGHPRQGASSATSLPPPRNGQASLLNGSRVSGSFMQDPDSITHLQKKPRLDIKHEDIMEQQAFHQYMQRRDSMQLQSPNPQLQALMLQQRLRHQQQQILQSMPPVQRAHLLQQQQQQQQQQQLQLRQLQQQSMLPAKRPYDGGGGDSVCSRRLMQYLYHQRQRPADNPIAYWRKFVSEYFSPRAKKRWCLSLYDNVGHHSLGVFPQAAMDAWRCEICGSKSGRGFEATFEVLPRLNEIKFGSGVIDELLFLDCPREFRYSSGIMMLEYKKAVQESVYEQLRVVREGRLRVLFSPDLKILSWEFCAQRHEELLPRRLVAPQVNQLLQVAQKCQSTIAESGSDGVSQLDLQTNSNMVVTAGRQLARSLELQSLNDLGFSKRYVRCLQISEVVNSMKDLMDFCKNSKVGPIDGLKNFPRQTTAAKLQLEKMEVERMTNIQGMPTDRNALNKLVALHPGLNNNPISNNNNHHIIGRGAPLNGSAQALAISNYQNLLMRQNSVISNSQQEASSSFNNFNQIASSPFQGSAAILPGVLQNSNIPINGFSGSAHLLQQRSLSGNGIQQQNHHQPQGAASQALQHHMMQQLLQDMKNNNNGGGAKQSISGQSAANGSSMSRDGPRYGNNTSSVTSPHVNGSGGSGAPSGTTRSNSFKAASHSDSSAGGGNIGGANQKTQDVQQNLHLSEEMVLQDIANEFTDDGFFDNNDFEDSMGYGWKA